MSYKCIFSLLLYVLFLNGCGFLLCGDRGVEQTWTMGHGVKCTGDVMCQNKWVHPFCCTDGTIKEDCKN